MSIEMYRLRTVVVWQYVLKSIEILHLCVELIMVIFFHWMRWAPKALGELSIEDYTSPGDKLAMTVQE